MIEPGYDSLTPEKKADIDAEVQAVIDAIGNSHGGGKWKEMVLRMTASPAASSSRSRPAPRSIRSSPR